MTWAPLMICASWSTVWQARLLWAYAARFLGGRSIGPRPSEFCRAPGVAPPRCASSDADGRCDGRPSSQCRSDSSRARGPGASKEERSSSTVRPQTGQRVSAGRAQKTADVLNRKPHRGQPISGGSMTSSPPVRARSTAYRRSPRSAQREPLGPAVAGSACVGAPLCGRRHLVSASAVCSRIKGRTGVICHGRERGVRARALVGARRFAFRRLTRFGCRPQSACSVARSKGWPPSR